MLSRSLRSFQCLCLRSRRRLHNPISLFRPKPSSLPLISLSPQSPNLRAMSSRPSASDMSGARAAAAKKKLQPSSLKKRKILDSTNPIEKPQLLSAPETAGTTQDPESVEVKAPKSKEIKEAQENPSCGSSEVVPAGKKVCVAAGAEERTEELKSRMPLLKKKAREFDPKLVANWGQGERIPFVFVCLVFDLIDKETGRIVITDFVCNMLRTVMYTTPEDLVPMIYLAANRIAPAHEGLELGIGDGSIIKALAEACGRTEAHVKKQYKEKGDLGRVANGNRSSQSTRCASLMH